MARPSRQECDRGMFHVMARSVPGIRLFELDSYKQRFLGEIAHAIRKHVAELYAFCVMTNHFHLLISTEREAIGRLVQPAMSQVAQRWNWEHHRKGPIYDDRAKAISVTTDEYFLNAARYIQYNPVKAGIVRVPEEYPWSSARASSPRPGRSPRHPAGAAQASRASGSADRRRAPSPDRGALRS